MKMGNPQTQREIFAQIDVNSIPRRHWILEQLATGSVSCRHVVIAAVFIGLLLVVVTSFGGRKGFSVTTNSVPVSYHYFPSDRRQLVILRSMPSDWPQQEGLMRRFANAAGAIVVLQRVTRDLLRNLDRDIALSHPPDVMWVFADVEGGEFVGVTNQVVSGANSLFVSKPYHVTVATYAASDVTRIPDSVVDLIRKRDNTRRLLVTTAEINGATKIPTSIKNYCPVLVGATPASVVTLQAFNCDSNNMMMDEDTASRNANECVIDMMESTIRCMKNVNTVRWTPGKQVPNLKNQPAPEEAVG